MSQAGANCNGKIWFFVADNIEVEVLSDSEQHISLKLLFQDTGGDFNVVLNEEEKIGGIPVLAQDIEDFAFCINSCELEEIQFKGSPFTWWNGRASNDCIFERLDRMLVNTELQSWFSHMEVEHLARTGSDHAPLLCTYGEDTQNQYRPFKFLKFWVEHESFLDTVQQNWPTWMHEDPFISFKLKLKHMKGVLSQWSRATYGDIFKQLIIREEIVRIKENLFEECPSSGNGSVLQQSQAELKQYLHYEEEYWRQKPVKGRRKRLQIQRIQDLDGNWLDNEEEMANEAESNEMLCKVPSNEEVKAAVFNLSGSSASGPDGFSGLFYQVCWSIVEADVIRMVLAFFQGATLPKSITHTNVVLIPKKEMVQSYSDLRPISLSNFINKVLSRVLHDRLEKVLPTLISPHQACFVKGGSIIENVLLTQEIVTDIRKRGKPANVVLKLDMAKMGFSEGFIDKIWRLIANNWYSILFNGKARGFFHSTRGVKQGDPLSLALFILTAEVLSRALNSLHDNSLYVGYGLPKWSANINHLAYADDTIIFASAERNSLKMIMDILRDYEAISGQLINIEKSAFYMYHKVADRVMQDVQQVTGFTKGQFPFKYLGCPIFHARRKKVYYQDLIKKVKDKLQSWKGKLLSYGGKAVLIGSVLQSVPVYVLSAVVPTKYTLNELHRIFARFFWSNKEEDKSKHWVSWKKICMPKAEGGLGFRSFFDIYKALFAKLWWRFRTSNSLWSTFLWNKYCKKLKPTKVQWKGGSQVWKKMLEARDQMDHFIWWEPRSGSCDIWEDNWTRLGPLREVSSSDHNLEESEETLQHLFLTSNCAAEVWQYYTTVACIIDPLIQLHQAVVKWWNMKCAVKLKPIFEAMPSFICWQLWKRRNALMNGAQMSKSKVIYCINQNIHNLISSLYPWLKNVPHTWPQMVQLLEGLNPRSGSQMVQWRCPSAGWYKCNTDGASRGNPGQSSAAFCIRDERGDLIHAAARRLSNTTNICAEATAIHDGLQYCVNNHVLPVIMETDSLDTVNIIQGDWETPLKVSMEVQKIKEWRKRGQVQFVHVLREDKTIQWQIF
ncbi:uncharacterized protein LOC132046072 [Lycium ferocissimum]|uniref:uncharacterized protein LOC132046072 n=1 Tax=Lycium ferocissimum TaxID=112874 RepID=UPI0028149C60|nr:uncharacterized protein LOC132046072 [Lycium ferocissimum]